MKKRGNNNEVSSDRRFVVGASLLSVLVPIEDAVAATGVRPTRELGAEAAPAKRLSSMPTTRFIFPASELRIEHVEKPNLYAERMESASRVVGGIALVLVAATIISQLTKRPQIVPEVPESVAVARVQWGAR